MHPDHQTIQDPTHSWSPSPGFADYHSFLSPSAPSVDPVDVTAEEAPESTIKPNPPSPLPYAHQRMEDLNVLGLIRHYKESFPRCAAILRNIDVRKLKLSDGSITEVEREILVNELAELEKELDKVKVSRSNRKVAIAEMILRLFLVAGLDLVVCLDCFYQYNRCYFQRVSADELSLFIGLFSEQAGMNRFDAMDIKHRSAVYEQLKSIAPASLPYRNRSRILINVQNGTLEFGYSKTRFRSHCKEDGFTFQLLTGYDPAARAAVFLAFLDTVLPNKSDQMVLAEFLGYLFVPYSVKKLEKVLLLYGTGANGKSVIFEVVRALIGKDFVTTYPLNRLTEEKGYWRMQLENALLNWCTEMGQIKNEELFKTLSSGEPCEVRDVYHSPVIIENYAKLIFSGNRKIYHSQLPESMRRRMLHIDFRVTIPEKDRDPQLPFRIISSELPGVLNWIIEGLERLISQNGFTQRPDGEEAPRVLDAASSIEDFVKVFNYAPSVDERILLKEIYYNYQVYAFCCSIDEVNINQFGTMLRNIGFSSAKGRDGQIVSAVQRLG